MKTFEVQWTQSAIFDLEQIIEYLKLDSVSVAKQILGEIREVCRELYTMPERKRVVPELQEIGIGHYREIIHKRWRIVFKVEQEQEVVYILIVVDARRNLEDILFQRLLNQKSD